MVGCIPDITANINILHGTISKNTTSDSIFKDTIAQIQFSIGILYNKFIETTGKSPVTNICNICRYCHFLDATSTTERILFNPVHAFTQGNRNQSTATIECRISNLLNIVTDCDMCLPRHRSFIFINHLTNAYNTVGKFIEPSGFVKCRTSNTLNIIVKVNISKSRTLIKSLCANTETSAQRNTCKSRATFEGIIPNTCNTVRDYDAGKAGATIEHFISNTCYTVGDFNACKTRATRERFISNTCNTVRDYDAGKAGATTERRTSNICYAVRDYNACKAGATRERRTSNACNAVRDYNACKAGAITERITSNACNAVRDFNACKAGAICERRTSNTCDIISRSVIYNTLGNHNTAGVPICSTRHLNNLICSIGNVVANTTDFKFLSACHCCTQQEQHRE